MDTGEPVEVYDEGEGDLNSDDYVEEKTEKDGTHIRKEVHSSGGVKTIKINKESPKGSGGGGPIDLMEALGGGGGGPPPFIQKLMQGMMSQGMGGGTIRI